MRKNCALTDKEDKEFRKAISEIIEHRQKEIDKTYEKLQKKYQKEIGRIKNPRTIKLHRIHDERYNATIFFAHNCTHEDVATLLNKHLKTTDIHFAHWEHMGGGAATITHKDHPAYIVWVREKKAFYTIVHECFHLTWKVFHDRFINCDYDNQEAFAYCMDFYVRTMWRIVNGQKQAWKVCP